MSTRPSRRAVVARKKVIQSDSDSSEVEETQVASIKRDSRRSTVGSRTSFDDEYTPRKSRQVVSKTPLTARLKLNGTPAGRAPLSETENDRAQSQTPRTVTKRGAPLKVDVKKEGYEGIVLRDSVKENVTPFIAQTATVKASMPPPPTLPIHTLLSTKSVPLSHSEPVTIDANVAAEVPPEQPTGPKTRIVISKLVLENFKSYAGIQCIGPFHKSFSAVVGPNGSGKSNVIDSLLFVFGFRASKMRQGKISALIHNSAAHPDLASCSVEVHFETIFDEDDNPDAYQVVPNSSIVVARKAYKNNSSKYTINDRESSFTEVTTLLKDRGIDLDHKRFLILQGEVESIAQMRPKAANEHDDGLLEYLEDIIGTSKYKAPIEGALERMEALSGICQEKNARVQIVEKERARLEERKDIALQQILTENELAIKQSALYQLFVAECAANLSVTQECITELEAELQSSAESYKGNEELIKTLEKKHKTATKNHDELKTLLARYSAEAAKAEKANVSTEEKMKHLSSKQKKLSKSNSAAKHALQENTHLIETYETEIKKFRVEMTTLDNSLAKEDQELTKIRLSLKDKTQVFSDQIELKQKQKQPWDAQISAKQSALEVAKSELDMLNEKSSRVIRDLGEATSQLADLSQEIEARSTEEQEVDQQISEARKGAATMAKQLIKIQALEASVKQDHSTARDRADEAKSNLAANKQKGDVLTGLTSLSDSGRISGFHGRLGDLGTIDDKYDVAITTACPALNNIVVDNVEVGQKCIDHLRRNNLGRANFILLDKLPARDSSKIQTPENVPRLVDLVKVRDAKFTPAFFKVLSNTVVATDLEQANRIAYGKTRWRVVTLDGQLIEASGAMTGGGARVSRGGMSSKFAASETKENVTKLEALESNRRADLDKLRQEVQELESQLDRANLQIPQLEVKKSRLSIELEAMKKQTSDMRRRISDLTLAKGTSTVDTKKVLKIEESIASYENAIVKLTAETAGIEDEIRSLQDKILEVGGIKLRTQKSKVDGLRDQIDALTQRCDASELSKTKAEKDIKKLANTSENGEAEIAAVEDELQALRSTIDGDKTYSSVTKEMEETKYVSHIVTAFAISMTDRSQAIDESAAQLKVIKEELDAEMSGINAFRAKELELRNKLDDHKKRHTEDRKRLVHWQDKLEKLSIQELSRHFLNDETPSQALTELSEDELEALDKAELKAEIAVLEETTQNAKIETGVLEEYLQRCEEYNERTKALEEAVTERDMARSTAEDLRRRRLTEFMTGFNLISLRLKEMYQMITMGGNAELELVDSLDPFSEGILFSVMPPKKSWKNISNLSGGEKTLSSLALVFALHHYKPTPLYVMDEIDAALDFRNVSIVANYIKDRTKNAQFIVISLRNNMFELSARLIGIYKTSNMTKSIAIENTELAIVKHQDKV